MRSSTHHIAEVGTESARKIYNTMKSVIDRLQDFPLMGQTHPDPILAVLAPGENRHFEPGENSQFQPGRNL